VPLSTVSRIYYQLEHEGILSRIRSSRTTIRGLKYDRKLSVRAFVGLPTAISKYVTVQDYRMFFMRIRRELRLNGFAAAMLDIEHEAEDLSEQARKHEIDTIIWFQPGRLAKQAILRLNDLGLRVVGVSDGTRLSLPCHYQVRRETAIRNILRSWQSDAGLKSVIVVSGQRRASVVDQERFEEMLSEEEFKYEFRNTSSSESIPKVLKSLSQKENTGIAFFSSAAPMFAFRSPELMTRIFQRCRVALIEGPVNMPFANIPDVRVDLVMVDWQAVVKRIVRDLIAQEAFDDAKHVIFEAEAHLRVPLSNYAQVI
jgi:hypothetical protein